MEEVNKYYLYRHIRIDNDEPFYIGIGHKMPGEKSIKRIYKRAFTKSKRNIYWQRIVAKTDYEVQIMFESDDHNLVKQKEIEFISIYGRSNLGKGTLCNLTDGGEGVVNAIISLETRKKISKRLLEIGHKAPCTKGIKYSDDQKRVWSQIRILNPVIKRGLDNWITTPMAQYDKGTGELVFAYESKRQVTLLTGIQGTTLKRHIDKGFDAGGYIWKEITKEDYMNIDLTDLSPGKRLEKHIEADFGEGNIQYYDYPKDFAKVTGCNLAKIRSCLRGEIDNIKNIKLKYVNKSNDI